MTRPASIIRVGFVFAVALVAALCALCAPQVAHAASVLSLDTSDMAIAVGEEGARAYSLSTPGFIATVNGQTRAYDYELSATSSDPTIARAQAADGSLVVQGYSGGRAVITLSVLSPLGGTVDERSFTVEVEGEDMTLDQAIVVTTDEEEQAALERLDELNGVKSSGSDGSARGAGSASDTSAQSAPASAFVAASAEGADGEAAVPVVPIAVTVGLAAVVVIAVYVSKRRKS